MSHTPEEMTFWDHLEVLRGTLIKGVILILVCSVVVFFFKEPIFEILLAPQKSDFITYKVFKNIGSVANIFKNFTVHIHITVTFKHNKGKLFIFCIKR